MSKIVKAVTVYLLAMAPMAPTDRENKLLDSLAVDS